MVCRYSIGPIQSCISMFIFPSKLCAFVYETENYSNEIPKVQGTTLLQISMEIVNVFLCNAVNHLTIVILSQIIPSKNFKSFFDVSADIWNMFMHSEILQQMQSYGSGDLSKVHHASHPMSAGINSSPCNPMYDKQR